MPFERKPDEIGALWSKESERGEYLTGEINGVKVVCFRSKSTSPKAPTWTVLKSKPKPQAARSEADDSDIAF